jgi:hypothetical protein
MPDRFGSPRHLVARLVGAETLIPVGVAAAAGMAVSAIVPPHWRAAGLPYLLGYGKNVESAAVTAALAAGAATQLWIGSRRGFRACAAIAACGFALVAARCPLGPLVAAWPQLVAIAALAAAIGLGRSEPASAGSPGPAEPRRPAAPGGPPGLAASARRLGPDRPGSRRETLPAALAEAALVTTLAEAGLVTTLAEAALVATMAGAVFALTVGPPLLAIDVFHHGEVLSTAVDLVRGGRPFESLIWPHGLHDTGLGALWVRATGKVGTSAFALEWASSCALGIVTIHVLVRRLLGSRSAALAACLAAALAPLLLAGDPSVAVASALQQLGVLVFAALAFAAVTAHLRRDLAAGLCCGLAHLVRIEAGVYATVAALAVIAYRELAAAAPAPAAEGGAAKTLRIAFLNRLDLAATAKAPRMAFLNRLDPAATAKAPCIAFLNRLDPAATAKALGAALLRFLAGAVIVLGGFWLAFGWPGAAWFRFALGDLPRYHRDAVGMPLPWPRRGAALSPVEQVVLKLALSRLLLILLLLVQAVRAVLEHRRGRAVPARIVHTRPAAEPALGCAGSLPGAESLSPALRGLERQDPRAATASAAPSAPPEPLREAKLVFVALFGALAIQSALDRSDLGHLLQWTAFPLLAAGCLAVGGWSVRRSWTPLRAAMAAFFLPFILDFGWLGLHLPALRSPSALAAAAREKWHGTAEHLRPNPPAGACGDTMFTPAELGIGANRRFVDDECAVEALLRSHGVRRMVIADSAPWYDVRFHFLPATRYYALARAYTPAHQLDLIAALRARPVQALLLPRDFGGIRDFDVPDALRVPVADAYLRARRAGVAATPTPLGDFFFWNEPAACPPPPPPDETAGALLRPRGSLSGPEWAGLAVAIERAAALGRADRAAALGASHGPAPCRAP